MADDADRAAFLQMAHEIEMLHQPRKHVTWVGLNPNWDGSPTADLDVSMIRQETIVCTAGCEGEYPCDTLKAVRSG